MSRHSEIWEIDLLAYADGLLEEDTARKAAVERYLACHPDAAERVAEIAADNQEIQELYGREIAEPIPERLLRTLDAPPRTGARFLRKTAATIVLVAIGLGAGWSIGQDEGQEAPNEFVEQAALHHQATASETLIDKSVNLPQSNAGAMGQKEFWLRIEIPDLSQEGYRLVAKEEFGSHSNTAIRLVYRAPDSTTLNLILRPRRSEDNEVIRQTAEGGVTVRYWPAGPFAVALTADATDEEADRLARLVQESFEHVRLIERSPPFEQRDAAVHGTVEGEPLTPDQRLAPPVTSPISNKVN